MAIGRFYFSGEELCRFGDSGDPGVEDAHWCLWEEVEPALATKDAEIARLKAQRDRLAWYFGIEICRFEKAMGTSDDARRERARKELADIGLRIVGGQVEEIGE